MKKKNAGNDAGEEEQSADNVRKGKGIFLEERVTARFRDINAKRVRQRSTNCLIEKCQ